ncbi:MAG: porin family protein [Saprospiraceae bacterium]|nr:PorT family protein [Saprospiraceae bacterium]
MIKKIGIFIFGTLVFINILHAQRFGGGLKFAGTLSQIDGDDIFGFHKPGFELGLYGRARLSKTIDLEIDFSFNQRGSLSTKNDIQQIKFNLNYIDIPVLLVIKDWLNGEAEKEYYRMHFFGGLSVGRLISSSSYSGVDEDFNKNDLSWVVGTTYYYSRNWGITAKYSRSFTSLYEYYKLNRQVNMISYFISLGFNFKFN